MNVLFLTQRLPFAPNRGDRIRAYFLLRELARFAEVSVFSLTHDDEETRAAATMPFARRVATARVTPVRNRFLGAVSLLSERPLTHALLDAPDAQKKLRQLFEDSRPDVVIAYCSSMAKFALQAPLNTRPVIVDFVDADSVKWRQAAERATGALRWIYAREARTLGAFEAAICERAFATFTVNARESDAIRALAPGADVGVIQVGVDLDAFLPSGPPTAAPEVVFCGVMNYEPNVEGVRWFLSSVWPLVLAQRPDARFTIVGASPSPALHAAASQHPSVTVTGAVPAVQSYLWRSAVSVAPLQLARGTQTKVLEALAAGLPVVITTAVSKGLPAEAHAGCRCDDSPDGFARAVLDLLSRGGDERRAIAGSASMSSLSWSSRLQPVEGLVRAAATSRAS